MIPGSIKLIEESAFLGLNKLEMIRYDGDKDFTDMEKYNYTLFDISLPIVVKASDHYYKYDTFYGHKITPLPLRTPIFTPHQTLSHTPLFTLSETPLNTLSQTLINTPFQTLSETPLDTLYETLIIALDNNSQKIDREDSLEIETELSGFDEKLTFIIVIIFSCLSVVTLIVGIVFITIIVDSENEEDSDSSVNSIIVN